MEGVNSAFARRRRFLVPQPWAPFPSFQLIKIFASIHLGPFCEERKPLPAPGGIVCVWAPGQEPGPSDKGRAVIYSGSCTLRCCGREWRGRAGEVHGGPPPAGQTTPARPRGPPGPAASAARLRRARASRGQGASALPCSCPQLPSLPPPPPTASRKRVGAERKGHPSGWRECARPHGGRGRRAEGQGAGATGPAEAAACVVLFLDSFQLLGKKKHLSQGTKKRGVGKRS